MRYFRRETAKFSARERESAEETRIVFSLCVSGVKARAHLDFYICAYVNGERKSSRKFVFTFYEEEKYVCVCKVYALSWYYYQA